MKQTLAASNWGRPISLISTAMLVLSCAQASPPGDPVKLTEKTKDTLGCGVAFEDDFYDSLYAFLQDGKELPNVSAATTQFHQFATSPRFAKLSEEERAQLKSTLADLYKLVAIEAIETLSKPSEGAFKPLEAVSSMEMGARTTPARESLQDRARLLFDRIDAIAKSAGIDASCTPQTEPTFQPEGLEPKGNLFGDWKRTKHAAVYGGLKALATAYQSCEAAQKTALNDDTPDLKGIKKVGLHEDKIGTKRVIDDLDRLISTHPYLSDYRKPGSSCFNVLANPMIYDYGGKPHTTSSSEALDFFKDDGSGTKVLGIDCSGYVYSAFATAGLKLKKSGRLKAVGVHSVQARDWMRPSTGGLTCFDYVRFKDADSLRPGDVAASSGHVVIIDTVGKDPFGIAHIEKEADCKTSNISTRRFNFTVLQSAPVKEGIGINRIRAADYLSGPDVSIAVPFVEFALAACQAKTKGTTTTGKVNKGGLVRHLGTAECRASEVKLVHQECVQSCESNLIR